MLHSQVFQMLKEQTFYQPKAETYMKLIILLGRSGQPQHAWNLFNMMVEDGLEPTASRKGGSKLGRIMKRGKLC
nr:pentatricopeptide repeat-containing protein [Tanacetum cinerariifolium]